MKLNSCIKYVLLALIVTVSVYGLPPQPAAQNTALSKPTIAVLALKSSSGVTKEEAELLADRLGIELFKTGKFSVMERQQMEQVLKEQGFQQSGSCSDEGCIVQMGQLLGVQQLVSGSLGKLGNLYVINIRSIDVSTGKIARVVSRDIKGDLEDVVGELGDIAAVLSGSNGEKIRTVEIKEENVEQVSTPAASFAPSPAKCEKALYLEAAVFTRAMFGLDMPEKDYREASDYSNDEVLDGLNECFDDRVEQLSADQIAGMPDCNSIIIRMTVNSYKTAPEPRSQFCGTSDVILSFYEGTKAVNPSFRIQIIKTGDRDPGLLEPLTNSFDVIGEEIADNLDDQEWIRKLQRRLPR